MNINPRLKLALIRAYSKDNGFVTVMVTVVGLVMLFAATGMVLRTHQNKVNAFAQNQSAASLGMAETGLAQTMHLLEKYPPLAMNKLEQDANSVWNTGASDWNTTFSSVSSSNSCISINSTPTSFSPPSDGSTDKTNITKAYKMIDGDPSNDDEAWVGDSKKRYRVRKYEPDLSAMTAILQIEGQYQDESISVVEVEIPLEDKSFDVAVPGVWVDDSATTPIEISASQGGVIKASVCINAETFNSSAHKIVQNDLSTDTLPTEVGGGQPTILPSSNGPSIPKPGFPDPPPEIPIGTVEINPLVGLKECYIILPRIDENTTDREYEPLAVKNISDTSGDHDNCHNFNDSTDVETPDANGIYHYIIKENGDKSIDGKVQIIINPPADTAEKNYRVALHLEGAINIINWEDVSSQPKYDDPVIPILECQENGSNTTTHYLTSYITSVIGIDTDTGKYIESAKNIDVYYTGTEKSTINQTVVTGFYYFPNAEITTSQGQIRGSAWAKKFEASNSGSSCGIAIDQMEVSEDATRLAGGAVYQTLKGGVNTWKRVNKPDTITAPDFDD